MKCYSRCAEEMSICGEDGETIRGDFEVCEHFGGHGGDVGVVVIVGALRCFWKRDACESGRREDGDSSAMSTDGLA